MLAQQGQDLAFDPLTDDMLPPAGLIVDELPLEAQDVDEQAFGQPMLAHHADSFLAPLGGQLKVSVTGKREKTVPFHPRHSLRNGRTRMAQTLSDTGSQGDDALFFELVDRPQVHLRSVNQVRHLSTFSLNSHERDDSAVQPCQGRDYVSHMSESLVVPARFCGPPNSGNGGWTSGHLAQLVDGAHDDGAVTVRLRTPPPLDTEMAVSRGDDGTVELWDGQVLVAQAFPAEPLDTTEVPLPVSHPQALAAGASYEGLRSHPFPTCFACGTERDPSDALCLRTGVLTGQSTVRAAAWTPRESTPELVWAALDCPGAWASGIAGRELVLGTMTASIRALPSVGEPYVVMAWPRGQDGRKYYSGTCLYAAGGQLLAQANAVWIAVDAAAVRSR